MPSPKPQDTLMSVGWCKMIGDLSAKRSFDPQIQCRINQSREGKCEVEREVNSVAGEVTACFWLWHPNSSDRDFRMTQCWVSSHSSNVLRTVFWAATIVHWRIPHFYLMHRALHPWRIEPPGSQCGWREQEGFIEDAISIGTLYKSKLHTVYLI